MRATSPQDYRKLLAREFTVRRAKNPRYSLRAFARFLEVTPATLSKVLNKKRGLSIDAALKISEKLQLDANLQRTFLDSVESLHARSHVARSAARLRLHKNDAGPFHALDSDSLAILASWRAFAILELISLPQFAGGAKEIAQRLKLDVGFVEETLLRLMRVGLLAWSGGAYQATHSKTWGPDDVPDPTIRSYQRDLLQQATLALEQVPQEARDVSSLVFAAEKERLPEMKAFLRRMHKEFYEEFGNTPQRDTVYGLAIQCFPLSQIEDAK
ncbi:MAG: TIGR02147 family protein [Bdellovibrionales bacterium]|nr:TIGR02147 family protein [Bdellovibrionales bacterium]